MMLNLTIIQSDGRKHVLHVQPGTTIREAAIANSVSGVPGECGGCLSCASCHVYVDLAWIDRLAPMTKDEDDMLDGTFAERLPNSRLGCQVAVTPDLDGLVVHVPGQ